MKTHIMSQCLNYDGPYNNDYMYQTCKQAILTGPSDVTNCLYCMYNRNAIAFQKLLLFNQVSFRMPRGGQ